MESHGKHTVDRCWKALENHLRCSVRTLFSCLWVTVVWQMQRLTVASNERCGVHDMYRVPGRISRRVGAAMRSPVPCGLPLAVAVEVTDLPPVSAECHQGQHHPQAVLLLARRGRLQCHRDARADAGNVEARGCTEQAVYSRPGTCKAVGGKVCDRRSSE